MEILPFGYGGQTPRPLRYGTVPFHMSTRQTRTVARLPTSLYFRHVMVPEEAGARAVATATQRARLLDAMNRAVAAKGYSQVTVADVVGIASVSRRTFYQQFADKEACFLACYAAGSQAVIQDIAAAVRASGATDWRERVRAGLEAYTDTLSSEPDLARTLLVDVLGAGPRAVSLRREVLGAFTTLFRPAPGGSRESDEALRGIPEAYLRGLVGAISELVQEHISTDGAATLRELTPTLVDMAYGVLEAGRARAGRT